MAIVQRLREAAAAVFPQERDYDVSTVTDVEQARTLRYLIRAHYANPDHGDDGQTDCPLYYGSIEGIGGDTERTIARLKSLPKKNAASDYRMISPFNYAPKMVQTDVSCMVNGFKWDRLEVVVDGLKDDELSVLAQGLFVQAEHDDEWSLAGLLNCGAARGDCYTRPKPAPHSELGVQIEDAPPEAVFPFFDAWKKRRVDSYRMIYRIRPAVPSSDPAASPWPSGTYDVHVEHVNQAGVEVYRNGMPVVYDDNGDLVSGPHPSTLDEIPMVHIPYRDAGDFFGAPAAPAGIIAAIDDANVEASNLKSVLQGFGHPILAAYGIPDGGDLKWGRRMVKYISNPDAKLEFVVFKDLDPLLKTIDQKHAALRGMIPQLVIDDVRSGGESGVALAIRLYPYDTYLGQLERQFTKGLGAIVRIALKLVGRWPQRGKVEVKLDWGPRFPVDIMTRLAQGKAEVDLFGPIPEVLARIARREGYPEEEIQSILARVQDQQQADQLARETNAFGGGLLGAARAQQMRTQRQIGAGTPVGGQQP